MDDYKVLRRKIRDTDDVPKADDLAYRCTKCGGIIPSVPDDNIGCACGNIFIDLDCFRFYIQDLSAFQLLKRKTPN